MQATTTVDLASDPNIENRPRRNRTPAAKPRAVAGAKAREVAKPQRVTLTLDADAAKRLADHAHLAKVAPGAIVSELIRAGVPRYSFRRLDKDEATPDTGEDRQSETEA